MIVVVLLGLLAVVLMVLAFIGHWAIGILGIPFLFLFGVALYDYFQAGHSITRNFPLIGRSRFIANGYVLNCISISSNQILMASRFHECLDLSFISVPKTLLIQHHLVPNLMFTVKDTSGCNIA